VLIRTADRPARTGEEKEESMTDTQMSHTELVGEAFDEMGELVEIQGGGHHVGYWYENGEDVSFLEGINQCTEVVGSKLGLRPGQRLLDIGCGVAVPAIRYAQRYDINVVGLTNSRWQIEESSRRVKAAGVRTQIKLDFGDAAALPYPDDSFDAVLAFQSMQHAQDRGQWQREMARVVRPGGNVVIVDFIEEVPLTDEEVETLFGNNIPMEKPLPLSEFLQEVRDNGLTIKEALSCGDRIRPSYPKYFERVERIKDDLIEVLGKEKVEGQLGFMRKMLPIYRDKIGYLILTATKE
jgi:N-methyltransferase StaMA